MPADEGFDKIHIRDIRLRCVIGAFEEERRAKQEVIVNLTLHADLRPASRSDRIEDAVDYEAVEQRVAGVVEHSSCFLLESLAERIAEACLADPRVRRAVVVVDKPGALRSARSVAVEIERDRESRD